MTPSQIGRDCNEDVGSPTLWYSKQALNTSYVLGVIFFIAASRKLETVPGQLQGFIRISNFSWGQSFCISGKLQILHVIFSHFLTAFPLAFL